MLLIYTVKGQIPFVLCWYMYVLSSTPIIQFIRCGILYGNICNAVKKYKIMGQKPLATHNHM